jgi:hypothetical protein
MSRNKKSRKCTESVINKQPKIEGELEYTRSGQFRRQKSIGPLKKPRKMADYVFFPPKKHEIPHF